MPIFPCPQIITLQYWTYAIAGHLQKKTPVHKNYIKIENICCNHAYKLSNSQMQVLAKILSVDITSKYIIDLMDHDKHRMFYKSM